MTGNGCLLHILYSLLLPIRMLSKHYNAEHTGKAIYSLYVTLGPLTEMWPHLTGGMPLEIMPSDLKLYSGCTEALNQVRSRHRMLLLPPQAPDEKHRYPAILSLRFLSVNTERHGY